MTSLLPSPPSPPARSRRDLVLAPLLACPVRPAHLPRSSFAGTGFALFVGALAVNTRLAAPPVVARWRRGADLLARAILLLGPPAEAAEQATPAGRLRSESAASNN